MKRFIVCLALLIAGAVVFIACQKNNSTIEQAGTTAQIKEQFKTFYEKQKPAKSSRDILGTATPDWNKAEFDVTNNFVFAPILLESTNASKILVGEIDREGNVNNLCYYVVVNNNSNTFNPVNVVKEVIENKKSIQGAFSGAVLKYSLSNELIFGKDFKEGMQTKKCNAITQKKPTTANNNYISLPECLGDLIITDWYLLTFDEDGYIIDAEYLGTTQYCTESGGGGGNQAPDCCVDPNVHLISSSISEVSADNCGLEGVDPNTGIPIKSCTHKWFFNKNTLAFYTWKYESIENANLEKIGGTWKFKTLSHVGMATSGTIPPCVSFNCTINSATPSISSNKELAKMDLVYTTSLNITCCQWCSPTNSSLIASSSWNAQ